MTSIPIERIEDHLDSWGHAVWGFVIYRSTYVSDADLEAVLESMKAEAAEAIEMYGANERPIALQLTWTLIEDRDKLEDVSKKTVRSLFDEWCQTLEATAEQPNSVHPVAKSQNPRYRFCVQIDEAALESFKQMREPWVNLVMRKWPYQRHEDSEEDEGNETEESEDECYEPLEGCTDEDVGWCKVKIMSLIPAAYSLLSAPNAWYLLYTRPPCLAF